jgi:hypothetical protein
MRWVLSFTIGEFAMSGGQEKVWAIGQFWKTLNECGYNADARNEIRSVLDAEHLKVEGY